MFPCVRCPRAEVAAGCQLLAGREPLYEKASAGAAPERDGAVLSASPARRPGGAARLPPQAAPQRIF